MCEKVQNFFEKKASTSASAAGTVCIRFNDVQVWFGICVGVGSAAAINISAAAILLILVFARQCAANLNAIQLILEWVKQGPKAQ